MKNFEELMNLLPNRQQMEETPEMAEQIVASDIEQQIPQEPEFDPQIQDAINRRNKLQLFGNLLNATAGVTEAATGFKPSQAVAQNLIEQGQQGIEDVQRERKQETREAQLDQYRQLMQQRQLQIENQELLNNPESPASKISQRLADQLAKQQGIDISGEEINQMSAAQLETIFPELRQANNNFLNMLRLRQGEERLNIQRKEQEQRQEQEERRKSSFAKSYRDKMLSDPRFKDLKKQEQAFQQIPSIMEAAKEGNEVAVSSIGTRMARAMGEVGVLTDADVVRYLGNQSYGRKLLDWYNRGMKGQIPVETAEDIQAVSNIMQDLVSTQVLPVYEEYASSMIAAYPGEIEPQKALEIMGAPGYIKPVFKDASNKQLSKETSDNKDEKKSGMVKMRIPDGRIKMIPADKVEDAMNAGAKVLD